MLKVTILVGTKTVPQLWLLIKSIFKKTKGPSVILYIECGQPVLMFCKQTQNKANRFCGILK